ncbi:hypothetical protein HanXRQr2_Chr13g0612301 [Helianthus annuus]|uniref:Uncharacterized protein n=1 Tax=Helianthus annuus TaxID=4232 RepID=A0A9K3EL96_HELAN|nr:hypothetical protein HanXRQr2_Chr13g0612301 [Helianthus annuus]
MPSSYPGRHMPLPRLEPSTSGKRWVSVANWATPVGYEWDYTGYDCCCVIKFDTNYLLKKLTHF